MITGTQPALGGTLSSLREQVNHEAVSNGRIPHGGRVVLSSTAREFQRTITFRLEPSNDQFALLRMRQAQATQRMNRYSIALFAERNGWRPPEDTTKDSLTKLSRCERDDLSSAIYVACENRVKQDWKRIGPRIWSGVQIPTYKKGSLPIDSGARPGKKKGCCGIAIVRTASGGYAARLHVTANYAEGDNWIEVPLSRRTDIDERRGQKACEFADGTCQVLSGTIEFKRSMVLLRVAFKVRRDVPLMGQRVATLSEFADGRLLLRGEFGSVDYSSRLYALKNKKQTWDGMRRRFSRYMNRRKGSARNHREKLAQHSFSQWAETEMHAWSIQMVEWAEAQGCGSISTILIGTDWPANSLETKLAYKADERGIKVVKASLDNESTERAADATLNKRKQRAKKLGEAVREISHQLGDE